MTALVLVVPTTGPPPTWPISISAHLLALFPDPTMHNVCICHKSQAVWENARWGRGVCAFGHSGTILHPFGRQMVHPQTCSNPAAFQNFSCSCMMIPCCEVWLRGGGREGVFRGWPCRDRIRVQTQKMRCLRNTCMLSS